MSITEIDYMETTCDTDAHAQAAYVTNATTQGTISSYETIGAIVASIGSDSTPVDFWRTTKLVISATTNITAVSIYLGTKGLSPTGGITFRIETNNAGEPSGTLAHANATGTITSPTENAWNQCELTTFSLAAGTYWLVCKCVSTQIADTYYNWLWNAGGTAGSGYNLAGAGWTMINYYAPYKLIDNSYSLQSYSEPTIKTQGSYSLKAVAVATDSLNKTLTRTISPTVDLSNQTSIKFDIYSSRTGVNIKIGIHDSGGTTSEKTYSVLSVNTWETVTWDISGISNANKDAIDSIIITQVNADSATIYYIDNMYATTNLARSFGIIII